MYVAYLSANHRQENSYIMRLTFAGVSRETFLEILVQNILFVFNEVFDEEHVCFEQRYASSVIHVQLGQVTPGTVQNFYEKGQNGVYRCRWFTQQGGGVASAERFSHVLEVLVFVVERPEEQMVFDLVAFFQGWLALDRRHVVLILHSHVVADQAHQMRDVTDGLWVETQSAEACRRDAE